MDIRILVLDLDNTLLRSDKTLSERSAVALNSCRQKGIRIIFASARPLRDIVPYNAVFTPDAIVFHTGAGICENNRTVMSNAIPPDDGNAILQDLLNRYPTSLLSAEIGDRLYANFDAKTIWPFTQYTLNDLSRPFHEPFYKIISSIQSPEQFSEINHLLPSTAYARIAENRLILIMSTAAAKLSAVKQLCERWDIPLKNTAAFGDDHIDLDILTHCGVGVAVANAIPEALEAADHVTTSNNEDGVALWLEEHLL